MALNNPNQTTAAHFETEEETTQAAMTAQTANAQEATATDVTSTEAAPSASTAVAVNAPTTSALAVKGSATSPAQLIIQSNVLEQAKNAMPVTWEDFNSLQATQGQFGVKNGEGTKYVGNFIELHIVSHQDLFVSSPHDMDAQGEDLIKYSDDGITAQDGTLLADHQAALKAKGFDKAGIDHKLVLVGQLTKTASDGGNEYLGDLVQVVLPDTGRRGFGSHAKQAAFHIVQGIQTPEDAMHVRLTATIAGSGKTSFTKVSTGYAEGRGKKVKV